MSNYDFGNFNRDKDFSLYQIGKQKKAVADAMEAKKKEQAKEVAKFVPKQADAESAEVLGAYGKAFFDMNRKPDLAGLGLSPNDAALVAKYITPEQQARIEADVLGFFK